MRTKLIVLIGAFAFLGTFSGQALADSITLRDGRHLQGKFAGGTQGVIAFSVSGVTQYYDVSSILVMTFEGEVADAQASRPQQSPVMPQSGAIVPQRHPMRRKSNSAAVKEIRDAPKQKQPVRLILAAERTN